MYYTYILEDGTEVKNVKPNGGEVIEISDETFPEILKHLIEGMVQKNVIEIRKEER